MKTIILGREGDQPFQIKQQGVSKEHAKLTVENVNGREVWTLTDLDSSNGTMVRDEHGDYVQIVKKVITPDTYICLGPDNANGCRFFACHAFNAGNYAAEFNYMEENEQMLRAKSDKLESTTNNIRKLIAIVSAVALVGSFILKDNHDMQLIMLRIGTVVSAVSTMFFDPNKHKKQLKDMRSKLFECPNPACDHTLTPKEIHNHRCAKCNAKD